jgi:hypothetical protein
MENERKRNEYLNSDEWDIIAKEFPVFLLKKKVPGAGKINNLTKPKLHQDTIFCNYEKVDSVKNAVYFSDGTVDDHLKTIVSDITKSGNASLLLNSQNQYGTAIKFKNVMNLEYIYASVWYQGTSKEANMVASCGSDFYYINRNSDIEVSDDWKKLELSFWIPQHLDMSNLIVYLWNSGSEPIYFDDFQIVKRYKN